MAKSKHDWNSKENYYQVHFRVLKTISWKFINPPVSYSHLVFTDQYERLEIKKALFKTDKGTIVDIKIEKDIEIDRSFAKPRARTFGYSYQAKRPSPDGRVLVRYDSPHEDHRPFHHKHTFDENGTELKIQKIEDGVWPHLSEFFEEVSKSF